MDYSKLRIGYAPYSSTFDLPGDRRRFVHYARKRNLPFEIADPRRSYDVVVVSERGDLSIWGTYPTGQTKIVYDMVDAYLAIPRSDIKGLFRGLAKYVARESRYLQLNYWEAVRGICQRADAVICASEAQRQTVLRYCKNVHLILDFQDALIRSVKTTYSCGDTFNFVWEGLAQNLMAFRVIHDVLDELVRKRKIAMHIVTQLEFGRFMGKFFKQRTADLARKLFDEFYLYQWNEQLFSTIISACDLALIPAPLEDPIYSGKPANKLLLFWRMAVPAVVSATPGYETAMQQCGLPMACRSSEEWRATLERYMLDESARREAGRVGMAFANSNYSDEATLARWDGVFASLFG
jgi:hypothetical protein